MVETILVPLDGSLFSEQALGPAQAIAKRTGASLELVRVHVPSALREPRGAKWDDVLREEARIYLGHRAEQLERELRMPVPVTLLEDDDVAGRLCEHAAHHANAMVVMSTHGRTGVSRLWLGSVADGLVRRSPLPVLLVRVRETDEGLSRPRGPETGYKNILVPVDGSEYSEQVVEQAMELGRLWGAHLRVLTVVEPLYPTDYAIPVPVLPPPFNEPELLAGAQRYIDELIARLAPRYAPFEMTGELREGQRAAAAILERATQTDAGLIALATHGRGASRFFVGSVADKVLRGTTADVLTIRPMRD